MAHGRGNGWRHREAGALSRIFRHAELGRHGRRRPVLAAENRYPVATRVSNIKESFPNRHGDTRFGTEGSEVRILSPGPKYSINRPSIDRHGRLRAFFIETLRGLLHKCSKI